MADTSRVDGEATVSAKSNRIQAVRRLALSSVFQFICKILYLFFPRDVHDSFGIVEKAFAQSIQEADFEFCPFGKRLGNKKFLRLGTCHSPPADRRREIKLRVS